MKLLVPSVYIILKESVPTVKLKVKVVEVPVHIEVVPEINLIGFKGKWGKAKLKVFFLKHLRNERKFRSVNELKKQLDKDLKAARRFFSFTF